MYISRQHTCKVLAFVTRQKLYLYTWNSNKLKPFTFKSCVDRSGVKLYVLVFSSDALADFIKLMLQLKCMSISAVTFRSGWHKSEHIEDVRTKLHTCTVYGYNTQAISWSSTCVNFSHNVDYFFTSANEIEGGYIFALCVCLSLCLSMCLLPG